MCSILLSVSTKMVVVVHRIMHKHTYINSPETSTFTLGFHPLDLVHNFYFSFIYLLVFLFSFNPPVRSHTSAACFHDGTVTYAHHAPGQAWHSSIGPCPCCDCDAVENAALPAGRHSFHLCAACFLSRSRL